MKTHWKTLIYAILGNFMIAVINFLILTKPFLAEGKSQYTMITANALILLVFGIGIGKLLAVKNQYTTPSASYRNGMLLREFIWARHGFKLSIVLLLWLICLCNPLLAVKNQYTTPSASYRNGMLLREFIWARHGFKLSIVLLLWLICLCNPEIVYRLSDLLSLNPPYDGLNNPYLVSVWKQFIIYYVTSIPSITAWVMCYMMG